MQLFCYGLVKVMYIFWHHRLHRTWNGNFYL